MEGDGEAMSQQIGSVKVTTVHIGRGSKQARESAIRYAPEPLGSRAARRAKARKAARLAKREARREAKR